MPKDIFEKKIIKSLSAQNSHTACMGYLMDKPSNLINAPPEDHDHDVQSLHPTFFNYCTNHTMTLRRAIFNSRSFNLDMNFKFVHAAGNMVESMLNSGVSKYLEFKSLESIYLLESNLLTTKHTSNLTLEDSNYSFRLLPIPCSKGDVFKSSILNPLEKRSLMKFLQYVSDWSRVEEGKELIMINENELSSGSALQRPQNKQLNSYSVDVTDYQYKPFIEFLKKFGLSDKLCNFIIYCLCFDPSVQPTANKRIHIENDPAYASKYTSSLLTIRAMKQLSTHLNSLGRFGNTAFLLPLYGSGEVAQAFCRVCAVWGGTYRLRTTVKRFIYGTVADDVKEELVGNRVGEKEQQDPPSNPRESDKSAVIAMEDSEGNIFHCRNVVCNVQDWQPAPPITHHVITRMCVLNAPILPTSLSICVIPPEAVGLQNKHTIFVRQADSSLQVTPSGAYILYISTVVGAGECGELGIDLSIYRDNSGYSSEHTENGYSTNDNVTDRLNNIVFVLEKTFQHLKNEFSKDCIELFYAVISRPLFDLSENAMKSLQLPCNVYLVGEQSYTVHMNDEVEQAKEIFHKICPTGIFFAEASDTTNADGSPLEDEE